MGRRQISIIFNEKFRYGKTILKESSRGNERYGIVASSDARRLKAEGLDVKSGIEVSSGFER